MKSIEIEFTEEELKDIARALTIYETTTVICDGGITQRSIKIGDVNQRCMEVLKQKS